MEALSSSCFSQTKGKKYGSKRQEIENSKDDLNKNKYQNRDNQEEQEHNEDDNNNMITKKYAKSN